MPHCSLMSIGTTPFFISKFKSPHMINIQFTKFERKSIATFISEELPYACVPLGWYRSRSRSVIQELSGSWCIKGTGECILVMDSPVPLMNHDPDRCWITDPNPDSPKGTQSCIFMSPYPGFPHSRPQSPRSFRPVAEIKTSGRNLLSEHAKSIRFVFSPNQICQIW